jgi:antitoxin VapB
LILLKTTSEAAMPLQIANPEVIRKVDELAKATGLSKTAAVGRAVDRMLSELGGDVRQVDQLSALLAQLDRIPQRADAYDPLNWDEHGLPR